MAMSVVVLSSPPAGQRPDVAGLVDAIGTAGFAQHLIDYLHEVSGADHCAAFQLDPNSVSAFASGSFDGKRQMTPMVERYVGEGLWRVDPAMSLARAQAHASSTSLVRVDLDDERYIDLRPRVYPEVRDRVVICGRRGNSDFGLSVLRSTAHALFGAAEINNLVQQADVLLSAMAKHARVVAARPSAATALTDLHDIMSCLSARSKFARRELQVSARILYGMSTTGIALDLGIGEESVRTYRKRAYQRLGIASERELLHWYLAQWDCAQLSTLNSSTEICSRRSLS